MKVYQIVCKGNSISEEYARISRESFKPAIELGIITEIVEFPAITPDHPDFEEISSRYNWQPSLMSADLQKGKDDHSPSEKAGMCSHWALMEMQASSEERFWVMEHDTWLLDQRLQAFEYYHEMMHYMDLDYVNIGLFMGFYSLSQRAAKYQTDLLLRRRFPINCGPYCTLQRLFRTFLTNSYSKQNYDGKSLTCLHPWHGCDTIRPCLTGEDVGDAFNNYDRQKNNFMVNPTTQVISKRLKVTQDHHSYKDEWILEPWKRHKLFHVID